jgi:hypothetical protein
MYLSMYLFIYLEKRVMCGWELLKNSNLAAPRVIGFSQGCKGLPDIEGRVYR